MIYCPKCGTANRDGSRFCNECGQRLGAFTRVKCPECGAMNPVQNAFCSECGGRLLPSSVEPPPSDATPTIKGLSLPTKNPLADEEEEHEQAPGEVDDEAPAWLRELGARWPAEGGAAAVAGNEGSDDIPDWLKDLRASLPHDQEEELPEESEVPEWLAAMSLVAGGSGAERNEEIPGEEEQVPDWLAEIRGTAGGERDMPTEIPDAERSEAEEEEVPDWLAELRSEAGATDEEPAEKAPEEMPDIEEGEVPDWLAQLRGTAGAEARKPEMELPEAEGGDVPDWLAEMRETAGAEAQEPEVGPPEAEEGDVPDWLAEMRPPEAEEPEPAGPEGPVPAAEEGDVPDWLAGMQVSEDAGWEEAVPELPDAEEGEVPAWLEELRGAPGEEEPEVGEPAVEEEGEPIPMATMPGWLEELRPRGAGERLAAAEPSEEGELPDWLVPAEGEREETLARAEIPDWLLALKPAELREKGEPEGPAPVAEEPVEETGLLAGLPGTLPVEMVIAQPRAVAEVQEAEALPTMDTPQARLFAEIVGRPPEAAPKEIVQPQRRLLALLPRWLIYIALIAVVTLPLLSEEALLPRDLGAAPAVEALYDEIELLPDGAPVLVAFDYDPSTQDEMDVLARVLIDHLMDRQARIVAVSLYPAGPPVAQALLDELAAGQPAYAGAYGQLYANLGYLPGQATAVRLLGHSLPVALPRDFQQNLLADLPVVEGIGGVGDFALVLELAASEQSVRWWVEQAATPYDVPLAGGVSASVAPLSRPYYQTGTEQLVGLVGGLPDAATYQALRGGEGSGAGPLAARLDSLMGGHLVFILVLAIGSVVQLLRGSGGGR